MRQENNHVRSSGNMTHTRISTRGRSCHTGHTHSSRRYCSASNSSSSADSSSYRSRNCSSKYFNIEAVNKPSNPTPTRGANILITLPATKTAPKWTLLALFDSGTSSSLINYDKANKHKTNKVKIKTSWTTQGIKVQNICPSRHTQYYPPPVYHLPGFLPHLPPIQETKNFTILHNYWKRHSTRAWFRSP